MDIAEEITSTTIKIDSLHSNDTRIGDYWDQLIEILSRNEEETIRFLKENNDEKIIDHICGNFPEISYNLQSDKLIVTLEELDKRFPNLKLYLFIRGAKENLLHPYSSNINLLEG